MGNEGVRSKKKGERKEVENLFETVILFASDTMLRSPPIKSRKGGKKGSRGKIRRKDGERSMKKGKKGSRGKGKREEVERSRKRGKK